MTSPPRYLQPLKLPDALKNLGRSVRDNRLTNWAITRLLRAALPHSARQWASQRAPALGKISAKLPNGRKLRLETDVAEDVTSLIFYRGWTGSEPEVLPLWFELAQKSQTIIDVGAHVGHFTIAAALANPNARVFAFEPHPTVRAQLERNVALNHLPNVTVRGEALGREAGEAQFFIAAEEGVPSSSSLSESFMREAHSVVPRGIPVTVERLDAILNGDLPGPVLMKIDTETTEPDVLAGARALIERHQPIIFVEVLGPIDTGPQVAAQLPDYQAYLLTDRGPERMDRLVGHETWWNVMMIPAGLDLFNSGQDDQRPTH